MLRLSAFLSVMIVSALLFAVTGCGSSPEDAQTKPTGAENPADSGQGDQHAKIEANLAKLSPEEQKSARAQKICPVTEEPLGVMGPPIKVEVKDQTVWVCCKNCVETVQENPDKYLAILAK